MNISKDYYRYHVVENQDKTSTIIEEKIPLLISSTDLNDNIIGFVNITDEGWLPQERHFGEVTEGDLWLKNSNFEKAKDIFISHEKLKMSEDIEALKLLESRIGQYKESINSLKSATFVKSLLERQECELLNHSYVKVFYGDTPRIIPLVDYLDIEAGKCGYDSYEQLRENGLFISLPDLWKNKDVCMTVEERLLVMNELEAKIFGKDYEK